MRTLITADIHGIDSVREALIDTVCNQNIECLIIGGDILSGNPKEKYSSEMFPDTFIQFHKMISELESLNIPVYLTPGNHDTYPFHRWNQASNIHTVINSTVTLPNGMTLYMSPWSLTFCDWSWMCSEEDMPFHTMEHVDIVVSHGPAYGFYDLVGENLSEHSGSKSFLKSLMDNGIQRVYTGHIHNGVWNSECINKKEPVQYHFYGENDSKHIRFRNVSAVDDSYQFKGSFVVEDL